MYPILLKLEKGSYLVRVAKRGFFSGVGLTGGPLSMYLNSLLQVLRPAYDVIKGFLASVFERRLYWPGSWNGSPLQLLTNLPKVDFEFALGLITMPLFRPT